MKTGLLSVLISLLIWICLSACGPLQTGLNATATEIAANISTPQTPQAPTATFTSSPAPALRLSSPLTPTIMLTPTPTSTPRSIAATCPPTGISGVVKYTGALKQHGGISVAATIKQGATKAAAENAFNDGSSGEFSWCLPAGSYYVSTYMSLKGSHFVNPVGMAWGIAPNDLYVTCLPIQVIANTTVKIEVVITDANHGHLDNGNDTASKGDLTPKDCVVKKP